MLVFIVVVVKSGWIDFYFYLLLSTSYIGAYLVFQFISMVQEYYG